MLDSRELDAISGLVQTGTLTPEQAEAVRLALSEVPQAQVATAAAPPVHSWRDRLIEAAAYAGSALVGVAVVVLVAQNWSSLTEGGQVGLLVGLAIVTAVVAYVVARLTPGHWTGLLAETAAPRRRLASLMLAASSASLAGATMVLARPSDQFVLYGCVVGLVTMLVANRLATSLLTEAALFGWTVGVFYSVGNLIQPQSVAPPEGYANGPPITWYDHVAPIAAVVIGILWATVVSRLMRQKLAAMALGLGWAFVAAMPYAAHDATRVGGLAVMGVLAALGLWRYLVESNWMWLVFSIVTLGVFMFVLVGGASQPVFGFLAAGLVLLGLSAFGVWRRRHDGGGSAFRPRPV